MRYSLRGILFCLVLAMAACVGVAQSAPEEEDVVLARYALALDNLRRSMSELGSDLTQSLEHLERAAVPLGPLSEHTTSAALVRGMEATFDRARTAVRNQSSTDLMVQVSVLAGGFRRVVFESAVVEASAGNMDVARERLAYLARDMSLPEHVEEGLRADDLDLDSLRALFELGSVEAIQSRLDALREQLEDELDVAVAYRLLAQSYGLFIPIQDSPRAAADTSRYFLEAIYAIVDDEEADEAADSEDAEHAQDAQAEDAQAEDAQAEDAQAEGETQGIRVEALGPGDADEGEAEERDPEVVLREAFEQLVDHMASFHAAAGQVLGLVDADAEEGDTALAEALDEPEQPEVAAEGAAEELVDEVADEEEAVQEEVSDQVADDAVAQDVDAADVGEDEADLALEEPAQAEVVADAEAAEVDTDQAAGEAAQVVREDEDEEPAAVAAPRTGSDAGEAVEVAPSEVLPDAAAAPSELERELRAQGLSEQVRHELLANYSEAGVASVDQAFDRLFALGGQAVVSAGRGHESRAQATVASMHTDYARLLAPLVDTRDPALSSEITAAARALQTTPALRQQDVVTLLAHVASARDTLTGSRPALVERGTASLSQYWWGMPRMALMISLAIFAFVPLLLLNLAFGGGNRNWRWMGTALLLLLLPVIFEGLGFLGSLLADVTAMPALNVLAAYSMFSNPLTQFVWVLITAVAILFATIGLYGICVQFGLIGSRKRARTKTATSTGTQDATVDWDEEF